MTFHPYLFLTGTCREAFTRYQEILGGELEIMSNADAPAEARMPGAADDAVMHAAITLPNGGLLMGSDDPTGDGGPMKGLAVHLSVAEEAEAKRIFDALAESGELQMPFEATFWSKGFGACVDRFGVPWMVSVEDEPASS
jgi:PhnB protein